MQKAWCLHFFYPLNLNLFFFAQWTGCRFVFSLRCIWHQADLSILDRILSKLLSCHSFIRQSGELHVIVGIKGVLSSAPLKYATHSSHRMVKIMMMKIVKMKIMNILLIIPAWILEGYDRIKPADFCVKALEEFAVNISCTSAAFDWVSRHQNRWMQLECAIKK